MSKPVSSIQNLGPASEKEYARAGINSADELRALGADTAYRLLIGSGTKPHFIGYYALVMGLQGRPWNDCQGSEKTRLREKFEALKTSAHDKGRSQLETALNEIGVVQAPR